VYWLKVKNVGTAAGDVVLLGSDDTPDLDFKWLRGKNDVTDNVQGAGFEFALAKGQTKQFASSSRSAPTRRTSAATASTTSTTSTTTTATACARDTPSRAEPRTTPSFTG
jgi:hypothetical protein